SESAPGAGEALCETGADRVTDAEEHDRLSRCRVLGRHRRRRAEGHDDLRLKLQQLQSQGLKEIAISVGKPVREHKILAVVVSELVKFLSKDVKHCRRRPRAGIERQECNTARFPLLRLSGEWRGKHARAQRPKERTSVHYWDHLVRLQQERLRDG